MDVQHLDTGKFFGRIREPCTCCDPEVELYNHIGQLKYVITADCAQVGLCFGPSVQKMANIQFLIRCGNAVVVH